MNLHSCEKERLHRTFNLQSCEKRITLHDAVPCNTFSSDNFDCFLYDFIISHFVVRTFWPILLILLQFSEGCRHSV